ncbi:hypothetical protein AB0I10_13675 [Streptomyces sp. NPDC050636]|uniref:hypothetical protein n=1 Tax=Streptomyces sp. NPDC050636 TaxID=3154510 RepID=UPI003443DC2B
MHLIHVCLRGLPEQGPPDGIAAWLKAATVPGDALQHVSVHATGPGQLTIGLFHALRRLHDAESTALRLSRRAVDDGPLGEYTLLSCGAVMVPRFHNRLLAETPDDAGTAGKDGTGRDRFRPDGNASGRPDRPQD